MISLCFGVLVESGQRYQYHLLAIPLLPVQRALRRVVYTLAQAIVGPLLTGIAVA